MSTHCGEEYIQYAWMEMIYSIDVCLGMKKYEWKIKY